MGFPPEGARTPSAESNRAAKLARVTARTAHAVLVVRGSDCLGWRQYGSPAELPRIKHRKAYEAGAGAPPDWRITCFFVDRAARGQGVAEAALRGALALIRAAGGGTVEAMPEDATGRKTPGAFLWGGELGMFERAGFERVRPLGKSSWPVRAVP